MVSWVLVMIIVIAKKICQCCYGVLCLEFVRGMNRTQTFFVVVLFIGSPNQLAGNKGLKYFTMQWINIIFRLNILK